MHTLSMNFWLKRAGKDNDRPRSSFSDTFRYKRQYHSFGNNAEELRTASILMGQYGYQTIPATFAGFFQ